jgi:peroxiredoxin (alkyl hydroperoxide reductase subunit C)
MENSSARIGQKAPDFEADAVIGGEITKIKLSQFSGKRVVLMFYPADFTFVCPTELAAAADVYAKVKSELNTEFIAVSTDTVWSHYAWWEASPSIKKVRFPIAADATKSISRSYGVLDESNGLAFRGAFFIDELGILQCAQLYNLGFGRNTQEIVRILQAMQFMKQNPGQVCPMDWVPGKQGLKPGKELVGKI